MDSLCRWMKRPQPFAEIHRVPLLIVPGGARSSLGLMSTNDLPPKPQAPVSHSPLRQRLLTEIADVLPLPPASLPQAPEASESAEESACHPFGDLNITNVARQVDSLFLLRWLEGLDGSKKTPTQPLCTRPIPSQLRSSPDAAR